MPPGAPGALPVLPLGMCWQLQDGPDYHLSWGRGQGRLRRCGGVLWAFKRRKCVEIAKRALLAHLGLEHAEGTFLECTLFAWPVTVACWFNAISLTVPFHTPRTGLDTQVDSDWKRQAVAAVTDTSQRFITSSSTPLSPPC